MIEIRLATLEDALFLSGRLRECDRQELIAAAGENLEATLKDAFESSTLCWVVSEDGGKPFMIFGVAPAPGYPGCGSPWMVASDRLTAYPKELLKHSRWYVNLMNHAYPYLFNFVDARNTRTIQWLRWCGFELGQTVPEYGQGKVPFIHFHRSI